MTEGIDVHHEKREKVHADQSFERTRDCWHDLRREKWLLHIANPNGVDDYGDCRNASSDTTAECFYAGGRIVQESQPLGEPGENDRLVCARIHRKPSLYSAVQGDVDDDALHRAFVGFICNLMPRGDGCGRQRVAGSSKERRFRISCARWRASGVKGTGSGRAPVGCASPAARGAGTPG